LAPAYPSGAIAKHYTAKQLNQMASVVNELHLTDEQKQTLVAGLLEKNLSREKSNMVREVIGSAVVLTAGGVALWKDWGGARTFITKEVPKFVVSIPTRIGEKREDIKLWMQETKGVGVRERVGHLFAGLRSGFK